MRKAVLSSLAVLMLASVPCLANPKHAPLPEKLLKAKAVYIENHGSAKLRDQAYEEITKWGRFSVVEKRESADIVLLLSSEPGRAGGGTTSTYDPSANNGSGGWTHGSVHTSSAPVFHVEILDAKSGESLFSDTRRPSSSLKELRKRMEEQEKEAKPSAE